MIETNTSQVENNVVPMASRKSKSGKPTIQELVQDKDVADFFRLVFQKDLRREAIELLEMRIHNIKKQ